jgi:DNA helicase-2/ATP-dependent DNA helicase PcrA
VILGPPGCGKTTCLLGHLDTELVRGVLPHQIAFVTFTRAARKEVCDRVARNSGLEPKACPWFRTIHSAAFGLLGLSRDSILSDKLLKEFSKLHGYRLTDPGAARGDLDGDPHGLPRDSHDDRIRFVHEWARNRRLPLERALAQSRVEGVSPTELDLFHRRLTQFKAKHDVCDFADLLEEVLQRGLRPPVAVAFVDEAQDLSPLQIAVVEQWFSPCQRWYVAGDDDQAIYSFHGADPLWLMSLTREGEPEVLRQSHRVPIVVQRLAEDVIRQNSQRVRKEYRPTTRLGKIIRLDREGALAIADGNTSTFILARNRRSLAFYAYGLLDRAIPYVVEGRGGPSPLSDERIARAVAVAVRLPRGSAVSATDLKTLLSFMHADSGLIPRGAKARLREGLEPYVNYTSEMVRSDLGLNRIVDAIESNGPVQVLDRLNARTRNYLQRLVDAEGRLPEPKIRLTSIHGAKGREAELVVLVPDMSRATCDEYQRGGMAGREGENRVFYVGVTRTKNTLVLVEPRGRKHFDFPFRANEEGRL